MYCCSNIDDLCLLQRCIHSVTSLTDGPHLAPGYRLPVCGVGPWMLFRSDLKSPKHSWPINVCFSPEFSVKQPFLPQHRVPSSHRIHTTVFHVVEKITFFSTWFLSSLPCMHKILIKNAWAKRGDVQHVRRHYKGEVPFEWCHPLAGLCKFPYS